MNSCTPRGAPCRARPCAPARSFFGPTGPGGASGAAGPTGAAEGPTGYTGATGRGAPQVATLQRSNAFQVPPETSVDWNGATTLPAFCALSPGSSTVTFRQAGFYQVVTQFAVNASSCTLQWQTNGSGLPGANYVQWTDDGTGIEVMLEYTYFFQLAVDDVLTLFNTSATTTIVATNDLGYAQVQILKLA
jgi:hypothetical protein